MKEKLQELKNKIANLKKERESKRLSDDCIEQVTGAKKSTSEVQTVCKVIATAGLVIAMIPVVNGTVKAYSVIDSIETNGSIFTVKDFNNPFVNDDENFPYLELEGSGKVDMYYYRQADFSNPITNAIVKIYGKNGTIEGEDIVDNIIDYYCINDLGYVLYDGNIYTENGGEAFFKVKIAQVSDARKCVVTDENGNEFSYYVTPGYGTLVGDKVYVETISYVKYENGEYILPEGYVLSEIVDSEPLIASPYSEIGLLVNYTISDNCVEYRYTKNK